MQIQSAGMNKFEGSHLCPCKFVDIKQFVLYPTTVFFMECEVAKDSALKVNRVAQSHSIFFPPTVFHRRCPYLEHFLSSRCQVYVAVHKAGFTKFYKTCYVTRTGDYIIKKTSSYLCYPLILDTVSYPFAHISLGVLMSLQITFKQIWRGIKNNW